MTNEEIYEEYNNFIDRKMVSGIWDTIPHCDSRILHDPSDCMYCDRPAWQQKRRELGIASTGCYPNPGEIPCQTAVDRPAWTSKDPLRWLGNRPTSVPRDDPRLPEESMVSKIMYFDLPEGEYNDN